ncbi:MAG: hypothetical protein ACLQIK_18515 [Mycobacterium sp.]|uniref:hypothetical protein n=1 Tax=Mycobacterium sp. TaxID=1785 RepID=UPI003F95F13C
MGQFSMTTRASGYDASGYEGRVVIVEDEWETAEWVAQQDDRKSSLGALTHGLASRVNPQPVELSIEDVPLTGLDRLEQAVGDLVVCFEEGGLEIDDTTDAAADAHVTTYRVHLTLRRSEWHLAENAAATAVSFLTRNTATGLTRALNLLHTLAEVARSLSVAEREAISHVLANQWLGTTTPRDEVTNYGIDLEKLIQNGVLVESAEGLSVSA